VPDERLASIANGEIVMHVLGIDVAKAKFDVALLVGERKFRTKVFDYSSEGFEALKGWLGRQKVEFSKLHACMEATSHYSERLALWLYEAEARVSVVNPLQIKAYGQSLLNRQKTDRADAQLIARYCEAQQPAAWTPPSPAVRKLQALVARLEALQLMRVAELNRQSIAETAVAGSIGTVLATLEAEIKRIEKEISDHIDANPDLRHKRELIESIPGIGSKTSMYFLAWFAGPKRFDDVRQAVAFVGLSPRTHESGSSIRGKARIAKLGNARLRKALYFPAIVAIQHNPVIAAFAKQLRSRGKHNMTIIVAVMRKLVHFIYGVLKSGTPFQTRLAKP
jgi:transposase